LHLERGQSPENELSRIEVASRRGADLISKLLSFAQPGSLKPETFDLVQHFRSLAPDLPGNSPHVDSLHIQLPDIPLWIRSRPIEIEQVVFNLLWNALEAVPSPSGVEFSIARAKAPVSMHTPSAIRIRVRDEGYGMTAETLSRIFDPFFTTRADTGGHGLGLAVSYGLVQNSGGAIEVSSVPERGSCFDVWLPEGDVPEDLAAQSVQPPTPRPEPSGTTGGPKCRILVVEDNKDVREVVVALLQGSGFTVESASSGAEAIQTLERRTEFGVLVSDVVMPELDGIELLRELRARRNKVPVLLMSGFSPHNIEDPMELQPFAMLAKPFSGPALLETIEGLIELSDRGPAPPLQ
jgi:CheY-like chemotaxis protein